MKLDEGALQAAVREALVGLDTGRPGWFDVVMRKGIEVYIALAPSWPELRPIAEATPEMERILIRRPSWEKWRLAEYVISPENGAGWEFMETGQPAPSDAIFLQTPPISKVTP